MRIPMYAPLLWAVALGVGLWTCGDHDPVTPDGDTGETADLADDEEAGDTADPADGEEEAGILCNALDLDAGAFFGFEDLLGAKAGNAASAMPMYSWMTRGFDYNAEHRRLLLYGWWVNKLPLCACGYELTDTGAVAPGQADVYDWVAEHGIGRGSGLLTVAVDLATGESFVVSRHIGPLTCQGEPPSGGDGYDIDLDLDGDTVHLSVALGAGPDLRGCPIYDTSQTRALTLLSGFAPAAQVRLCAQNADDDGDCTLPAPGTQAATITCRASGAYACDAAGCEQTQ